MQYALYRGEGFVMITGAPGTGKTTLIDELLADISSARYSVAKLVSGQLGADDLLRMVSYAFGIAADEMEKSELLRRLAADFGSKFRQNRRSLLVVDEAQGLSRAALEELRLLTNLRLDGQPLLQIFLVGQEELRELVTSPELRQLNQRMIAACQMETLKPEEFACYVLHRLRAAGWSGRPTFEPEIFPQLFRFSNGVPRRINHICSRLLLHGCLEQKERLDVSDMALVIDELRAEHYAVKGDLAIAKLEMFDADDIRILAEADLSGVPAAAPEPEPLNQTEERWLDPEAGPESPPMLTEQQIVEPGIPPTGSGEAERSRATDDAPGSEAGRGVAGRPGLMAELAQQVLARSGWRIGLGRRLWEMAPLWGAAGALVMVLFILLVIVVSAPAHELRVVAKQSVWENSGIAAIRFRMLRWSDGAWPLNNTTYSESRSSFSAGEPELAAHPLPVSPGRKQTE